MLRELPFSHTVQTALAGTLIFASCFAWLDSLPCDAEKVASNGSSINETEMNDPKFHKQLLEIAANYESYGKVDDIMRWVPTLCMLQPPPKAQLSKSKDTSTHGQKLYYLYAKDRNSYVKNETAAAGQTVVKEAWHQPSKEAVKAAADDKKSRDGSAAKPILMFDPVVLGPKSGLYIMYNTGSKTPDTDDGWVYGTVTADAKTVMSSGRVQSCMGCHVSAPHGRLFGLQKKIDF